MRQFIINYIDMPERLVELLIKFLRQEDGKLSKRALSKEFNQLTIDEVGTLQRKYLDIFK